MLNWLIIGGGIHGTHVAHVLTATGSVARSRLRVLDPASRPLARWNQRTGNTGMKFMRSPSVHHLGVEAEELNKFSQSPDGLAHREFRYPYGRPAYDLFQAHNRYLIQRNKLDSLWLRGTATKLVKRAQSWDVETEQGKLSARRVVLSLGRTAAAWPAWSESLCRPLRSAPIHHLFEPSFDMESIPPWRHLVVVGGGISAAQVACRLSKRASREGFNGRVTLLSRHPARKARFDSDPCWNGPKCLKKFQHTQDYAQRRAQIVEGRYRGSIPHDVMHEVERRCAKDQLCLRQDEVVTAHSVTAQTVEPQQAASHQITLQLAGGDTLCTDRIILATGFDPSRPGGELIDKAIAACGLPCAPCGYPIVDQQLDWLKGLHVTGPLAELELGAVAPNIRGARMAAERLCTV